MGWTAVADDGWVRCCLLVGVLLLALSVFGSLPWALWLGWGYLLVLCVADARERRHSPVVGGLWQTRGDE